MTTDSSDAYNFSQPSKNISNSPLDVVPPEGGRYADIGQFFFNHFPIGFFRSPLDPDGSCLFANEAMVKLFGYPSLDDFLAIPIKQLYAKPDERANFIEILQSKKVVERMVMKFRKIDEQTFWGAVTARVIFDDFNQPIHIDGVVEDVTELKHHIKKLIEEKSFSDSIIEGIPGLFWLVDSEGYPKRWNKNVEQVYGYAPEELRNLHFLENIVSQETLSHLQVAVKNALQGESGYCEYEIVTKFGKKIAFAGDAQLVTINGEKYLSCVEIDITKRQQVEEKLKLALAEIQQLKSQTEAENEYLMDEIEQQSEYKNIIGQSEVFKKILGTAQKLAPTNTIALILGETGTGKGVMAQVIHNLSPRHNRPLIKVNCANLPATLIESILFGHEKGAFTNADNRRIGLFEVANGSSIFLDEIAEIPIELQPKLLSVIEDGEFQRLGGSKTIKVDTRIIAATNRNLEVEVDNGRFRQDLLFRLNVYPLTCPPLRKRKEDVPLFVWYFIKKFNKLLGKTVTDISRECMVVLEDYQWPGNVRELQNVIERSMINSSGKKLVLTGLASTKATTSSKTEHHLKSLREVECEHLVRVLEKTDWVIEGQTGAARILDLPPSTLRGRMQKYGIRRTGHLPQF